MRNASPPKTDHAPDTQTNAATAGLTSRQAASSHRCHEQPLDAQAALPHLLKSDHAHILSISPPLNLDPKWFGAHVAYTTAKYGMSMLVLGLAHEYAGQIGVNALWPRTAIATAAVQNLLGGDEVVRHSRKPEIMADAAHALLCGCPTEVTGRFAIDDEVLAAAGVTDLSPYQVEPGAELFPDFFL